MKILLTQRVAKLGSAGTVVEVADGYARNYLIRQGLGRPATAGAVARVNQEHAAKKRSQERVKASEKKLKNAVRELHNLVVTGKANDAGTLFAGITSAEIAKELAANVGHDVPENIIVLPHPLKNTGVHTIKLAFSSGPVQLNVTVNPKN